METNQTKHKGVQVQLNHNIHASFHVFNKMVLLSVTLSIKMIALNCSHS